MSEQIPIEQELNELAVLIGRLQRGELTRPEFRGHTVHLGVYTQRKPDRYFVRLRVPLGILTVAQLNALAETTDRCADGECHLTTRQGMEIHNLSLDGTLETLASLAAVGLSSHESGGNTVRGIMVCPHAGEGAGEPFDVTEFAALLNRHFLRHPDFQSLPRKIKIGFSCCTDDCTNTALHDLGFQARTNVSGHPGFRVLVGGGAGALPRLAKELLEFLPADDIVIFTEAFLCMFNRLGDRQNRRRSRVKFLLDSLGLERLREEVLKEWDTLNTAGKNWPSLNLSGRPSRAELSCTVRASVLGGNINSSQLRQVAATVGRHALTLRITPEQDFLLRDIQPDQLSEIKSALLEAGLAPENTPNRLTACPGSNACSNAFTNSRALAQVIAQKLAGIGGANGDKPLRIRVSGCTNGCALHVIADIGLEGLAQRRDGALIPAYRLWLGGCSHQQYPRLANDIGIVPARRVPDCVTDVVLLYKRERRSSESLSEVLERIGAEPFATVAKPYLESRNLKELAIDVGEQTPYRSQGDAPATTC